VSSLNLTNSFTQQDGWVKPQALREDKVARLLAGALDRGEAEAMALALELSADLILLDERDGRAAAERAGLALGAQQDSKNTCDPHSSPWQK